MPEITISADDYRKLSDENAGRRSRNKEQSIAIAGLNAKLTELTAERDRLATDLAALTADRDGLKAKLESQPDELRSEVERLTGELRNRDHKQKFISLAKGKVNPEALDTAWRLLGWKPEADEVDDAKMGAAIDSLVGNHSVLKAPAPNGQASGGAATSPQQPRAAGPGTGRGAQPVAHDPEAELAARYPNPGRLA